MTAAQRTAAEPWDQRIEAAGRIVEQARRKRGVFLTNNIDALLAEMSSPAVKWPERAREALEALYTVAREYDVIGGPIERLAQEAGLQAVRVPLNPLERFVSDLNRMRQVSLHAPVPATVTPAQIDPLDDPDDEVRETARARFVADDERRPA